MYSIRRMSNVCRLCLQIIIDNNIIEIDKYIFEHENISLREVLRKCAAELNLEVSIQNQLCSDCLHCVKLTYDFKSKINQTENKIKEYLKQEAQLPDAKIDLSYLVNENEEILNIAGYINSTYQSILNIFDQDQLAPANRNISYKCFLCDFFVENYNEIKGHYEEYHKKAFSYEFVDLNQDQDLGLVRIDKQKMTKPYKCIFKCGYQEQNGFNNLIIHLKVHTKPHMCIKCSARFSDPRLLKSHLTKHFDKNVPLACYYCDSLQKEIHEARKHYLDKHIILENTNSSPQKKDMSSEPIVLENMDSPSQQKSDPRKQDDVMFVEAESTSSEMKMNDRNSSEEECDISDANRIEMSDAEIKEENASALCKDQRVIHQCDHCSYTTYIYEYLNNHKKLIHSKFSCNVCDKLFSSEQTLRKHLKIHIGEEMPELKANIEKTQKKDNVSENVKDVSSVKSQTLCNTVDKPKWYKCLHCSMMYSNLKSFRLHLKEHPDKDFEVACGVCDFTTFSTLVMLKHITMHKGREKNKKLKALTPSPDPDIPDDYEVDGNEVSISTMEQYLVEPRNEAENSNSNFPQNDSNYCNYDALCTESEGSHSCEIFTSSTTNEEVSAIENNSEIDLKTDSYNQPKEQPEESPPQPNKSAVGYGCTSCSKEFQHQKTLKHHFSEVHKLNEFKIRCTLCDYITADNIDMEEHKRKHSNQIGATKSSKTENDRNYKSALRYRCLKCNEYFTIITQLEQHFKDNHPKSELMYACAYCQYTISRRILMQNHYKIHKAKSHSNKNNISQIYRCVHCEYACAEFGYLLDHFKRLPKHMESNFGCGLCSFATSDTNKLMEHKNNHIRNQTYFGCHYCNRKSYSIEQIVKHFKSKHTKQKNIYVCTICEMKFFSSNDLVDHVEIHKKLNIHHELMQFKPFSCGICSLRSAGYNKSFSRHIKVAHPEHKIVKIKCYYCSYECVTVNELKIHFTSQHLKSLQQLGISTSFNEDSKIIHTNMKSEVKVMLTKLDKATVEHFLQSYTKELESNEESEMSESNSTIQEHSTDISITSTIHDDPNIETVKPIDTNTCVEALETPMDTSAVSNIHENSNSNTNQVEKLIKDDTLVEDTENAMDSSITSNIQNSNSKTNDVEKLIDDNTLVEDRENSMDTSIISNIQNSNGKINEVERLIKDNALIEDTENSMDTSVISNIENSNGKTNEVEKLVNDNTSVEDRENSMDTSYNIHEDLNIEYNDLENPIEDSLSAVDNQEEKSDNTHSNIPMETDIVAPKSIERMVSTDYDSPMDEDFSLRLSDGESEVGAHSNINNVNDLEKANTEVSIVVNTIITSTDDNSNTEDVNVVNKEQCNSPIINSSNSEKYNTENVSNQCSNTHLEVNTIPSALDIVEDTKVQSIETEDTLRNKEESRNQASELSPEENESKKVVSGTQEINLLLSQDAEKNRLQETQNSPEPVIPETNTDVVATVQES